MRPGPLLLSLVCLLAAGAPVAAERHGRSRQRALFKLGASTAFVLVALSLDATASAYGQLVLAALALGWIGDACLLGERSAWFLAGLAAFLAAHVVFAAAFLVGGTSAGVLAFVAAPLAIFGIFVLRWLWRHLDAFHKAAVGAYVLAILVMCALALAHGAAAGAWGVAAGALAFAASDLGVARERFVAPGFVNKAWGLPVYYVAQLLLAWSVA